MSAPLRRPSATQSGPLDVYSIQDIVDSGLCIGCGLCAAVAPNEVEIAMTIDGGERPHATSPVSDTSLAFINKVCPGLHVELDEHEAPIDPMWGPVRRLARGFASDETVRFEAATGGVLTALGQYLLTSGRVERVLHVGPDPAEPTMWSARVSTTPEEVQAASGSRYGPAAPLIPLLSLLDEGVPLAVIAKPCDIAAVRNVVRETGGYEMPYVLAMACGGASRMTKTWDTIAELGIANEEVTYLRYRGFGNPGPTTVRSAAATHEIGYLEQWADEGTWDLQWRCKVCPDGMGEVADLVSLDCWPGGAPTGEDAGFNGIIARTPTGADLVEAAVRDGALTLDMDNLPVDETLENWQPHQSRRKAAVAARLQAMTESGLPAIETPGLRLMTAASRLTEDHQRAETQGTLRRISEGKNV